MAKKPNISNVASGYQSTTTINNNFENIRNAFDNTLSRDGSTPNSMLADLDMNGNAILNLGTNPNNSSSLLTVGTADARYVNTAGDTMTGNLTVPGLYLSSLYYNGTPVIPSTLTYNGIIKETQIATSGQTVFNLTTISYTPVINNLSVYVDGIYQKPSNYTENSSTQVTFSAGLHVGAVVDFVVLTINSLSGTTDATNLTYTSPGSGAVTRTVSSKLSEIVSVKDFGAVGDGVTDDTAEIQAAIDYATSSGKAILFPEGVYIITSPITIDNTSFVQLKSDRYRGASIKKTGNTVDGYYGVDALLVIKNVSPGYGYSHHIDGLNFDASTSSNAYAIYAPRISQTVIENGLILGATVGIYSEDAWLCSFRNLNIACGDPAAPSVIPAGSVAFSFGSGTSLFFQDCWARVCETGYYFRTSVAYSSLVSCACDHFTAYAYRFVGSNFAMMGCGAEQSYGVSAILLSATNSRLAVSAMQTTAIAPLYFFDLSAAEVTFITSRIDATTSTGVGTTFRLRSSSTLNFIGRLYPTNTATLVDINAGSQVYIQDRDNGYLHYTYTTQLNVDNIATPQGIAVYGGTTARATYLGSNTFKHQLEGTTFSSAIMGIVGNTNTTSNPGGLFLGKTRGTAANAVTAVQSGDTLGYVLFGGADGTALRQAAGIAAVVDGTPGASDMPGRVEISTSPDGSATPVTRISVKSTGAINFVPLASDPATAAAGDVYYNSGTNKLRCYNGTSWNDLF